MIYTPLTNQNIYLTSDIHGFHTNLAKGTSKWDDKSGCRDFINSFEMTKTICDNINEKVKEEDLLVHLGDFCFGGYNNIFKTRDMIKCKNVINIEGNHRSHFHKQEIQDLFILNCDYLEFRYKKILFCCLHYPMSVWNQCHKGSIHCHGHSHSTLKEKRKNRIDVGVDNPLCNYSAFHIDEIIEICKNQPENSVLDHHSETN